MEALIHHIRKFVDLSDQDIPLIESHFQRMEVTKKQTLVQEGQVCRHHYFVTRGCIRLFFMNEKGVEQTTQFALEHWWLSDYMSFFTQTASSFSIQAVEKSVLLVIDFHSQEKLVASLPKMEKYFRMIYQKANAASQLRVKYLFGFSREELYHNFITNYPGFVQRIPQYLLASFLGFTPEYLSELRKKKRS